MTCSRCSSRETIKPRFWFATPARSICVPSTVLPDPEGDLACTGLRQGQGEVDLIVIDPPYPLFVEVAFGLKRSAISLAVIFAPNGTAWRPIARRSLSARALGALHLPSLHPAPVLLLL
jgi:hypothetical protein